MAKKKKTTSNNRGEAPIERFRKLDVGCSFRKLAGADKGAVKLGVNVRFEKADANQLHYALVKSRIDCELILDQSAEDDVPGQRQIPSAKTEIARVACTAKCGSLSLQLKHAALTLVIDDPEGDIHEELWQFQDGLGRLIIKKTAKIQRATKARAAKDAKGNAGDKNPK